MILTHLNRPKAIKSIPYIAQKVSVSISAHFAKRVKKEHVEKLANRLKQHQHRDRDQDQGVKLQ
jgi:hypothetical protein